MIERYTLPRMAGIWSEENHFKKMLEVELFACEAMAKLGKVPQAELKKIKAKARFDIDRIKEIEKKTRHDVVAFINNVSDHIGSASRYFHQGLTSSDVLDTSLSCLMVEASDIILEDLQGLKNTLRRLAKKYKYTVMVGRTHGVHAEPTTFGLKMALFLDETNRNIKRIQAAREIIRVGKISGAVGTYATIEPFVEEYVCKKLGLKAANISTQVLQRDRHAEYLYTLALIGSSLEKLATEIRNLQKTEVREVEEPFAEGQKGSSAMPHKRNPVMCERVCGLVRVLRANALAAMEDVALWHERDITHSSVERIIIPDSTILLDYILNQMLEILDGLLVYPENMKKNLEKTKGLIFSGRVLVELEKKGLKRQAAYDIVQRNSMRVWKEAIDFKEALSRDREFIKIMNFKELNKLFDLRFYIRFVDRIFKKVGV